MKKYYQIMFHSKNSNTQINDIKFQDYAEAIEYCLNNEELHKAYIQKCFSNMQLKEDEEIWWQCMFDMIVPELVTQELISFSHFYVEEVIDGIARSYSHGERKL